MNHDPRPERHGTMLHVPPGLEVPPELMEGRVLAMIGLEKMPWGEFA
jgi:hypothetical protein